MAARLLAHYEIREEIGRGGMGVVYRAVDTRNGRLVALKLLRSEVSDDPDQRARFMREARAVRKLDHPNIATFYEVHELEAAAVERALPRFMAGDETDTYLAIAMELVEGRDLRALTANHPLPLETALDIALQVTAALEAAHARGVIHRDLKPANIRITADGRAKLLDFGLAKILPASAQELEGDESSLTNLTSDGMIMGTPPYIAQEQLQGRKVDGRADLYALGIILYEMLTGRVPYPGSTLVAYIQSLAGPPPTPAAALVPSLPPSLDGLVSRLIALDPKDRPSHAGEVGASLRDMATNIEGETLMLDGSTSYPGVNVGPEEPAWSATRRRSPPRWILPAVAALLLLLTAVIFWPADEEPRTVNAPTTVLHCAVLAALAPDEDRLRAGLGRYLALRLAELPGLDIVDGGPLQVAAAAVTSETVPGAAVDRARALGVDHLLLLDAAYGARLFGTEGALLWRLDDGSQAPPALAAEILRGVAPALAGPLEAETAARLSALPSRDEAAFVDVLQGLALLAADEGETDASSLRRAEESFARAVAADPRLASAHLGLSEALLRRSGNDEIDEEARERAHHAAEQAVALAPTLPAAHLALASALEARGDHQAADAARQRALDLNPALAAVHRIRAAALVSRGAELEARSAFWKAARARPDDWQGWHALGRFLARTGDYGGARAALEKSIGLAPRGIVAPYLELGALESLQGREEQALATYRRAPPPLTSAPLAHAMGDTYTLLGQLPEAEASYRLAINIDGCHHRSYGALGDLYLELERPREAADAFRDALRCVEEVAAAAADNDGAGDLALIYRLLYQAKQGQCPTVEDGAEAATAMAEGEADLLLARIFATCDQPAAARDLLGRALASGQPQRALRLHRELRPLR